METQEKDVVNPKYKDRLFKFIFGEETEQRRIWHEDGFTEGLTKGKEKGRSEQAIEATVNLLKMKLGTPEQIAQAQGLSLEKVLELQKTIPVEA